MNYEIKIAELAKTFPTLKNAPLHPWNAEAFCRGSIDCCDIAISKLVRMVSNREESIENEFRELQRIDFACRLRWAGKALEKVRFQEATRLYAPRFEAATIPQNIAGQDARARAVTQNLTFQAS